MYQQAKPIFLICETPLHAGSGSDLGIVDLPIQRERHTGFPKIEGSSLKGAIRSFFEQSSTKDNNKIKAAFGADPNDDNTHAGALGFSDARLLLFPIKSMKGVFAWATCPKAISQFIADLNLSKIEQQFSVKANTVAPDNSLSLNNGKVVLEEYTFGVEQSKEVSALGNWLSENLFSNISSYWKEKIKKDIIVLEDDDFKDFVNLSTEVITRTKIDAATGTVAQGALFTEEYLPAESIMYSLVLAAPEMSEKKEVFKLASDVSNYFKEMIQTKEVLQVGGSATLGKGLVRAVYLT